jgi:hypothetical protein
MTLLFSAVLNVMLPLVTFIGLAIRFAGICTTLAPPMTCFPDIVEGD